MHRAQRYVFTNVCYTCLLHNVLKDKTHITLFWYRAFKYYCWELSVEFIFYQSKEMYDYSACNIKSKKFSGTTVY